MKIVMLVNKELPLGLIVNTAAVLGVSLGKLKNELVGEDYLDKVNCIHPGIAKSAIPLPSTV